MSSNKMHWLKIKFRNIIFDLSYAEALEADCCFIFEMSSGHLQKSHFPLKNANIGFNFFYRAMASTSWAHFLSCLMLILMTFRLLKNDS